MANCEETFQERKSCYRRRAAQRRQLQHLMPRPQFLFGPTAANIFLYRKRQKQLPVNWNNEEILQPDEIAIQCEDLQTMRDSVDTMQQQLRRGMRDIQEIRDLVKQAMAQKRETRLRPAIGLKN